MPQPSLTTVPILEGKKIEPDASIIPHLRHIACNFMKCIYQITFALTRAQQRLGETLLPCVKYSYGGRKRAH